MKTPMQKLIDKLKFRKSMYEKFADKDKAYNAVIGEIDLSINDVESLLPEERQMIIDARESLPKQMKKLGWRVSDNDGDYYYNQKFGSDDKE